MILDLRDPLPARQAGLTQWLQLQLFGKAAALLALSAALPLRARQLW